MVTRTFWGLNAYFGKYGHDEGRNEEKDELLQVPGAPQHPLTQTHHVHGLTNTSLLLKDQLLQGKEAHKSLYPLPPLSLYLPLPLPFPLSHSPFFSFSLLHTHRHISMHTHN